MYNFINSPIKPFGIEQTYENQEEQKALDNAMQYTDRIYACGRDMRDQYCRGDYNNACVSAEQVAENSLNALAELNEGLTNKLQNHVTLVQKKQNFCPELSISNNSLKKMQSAYKNRYPNPTTKKIQHQYTKDEAKKMITDACEIGDYALDALDISLQDRFKQFGEPSDIRDINCFKMVNLLFNGSTNDVIYNL